MKKTAKSRTSPDYFRAISLSLGVLDDHTSTLYTNSDSNDYVLHLPVTGSKNKLACIQHQEQTHFFSDASEAVVYAVEESIKKASVTTLCLDALSLLDEYLTNEEKAYALSYLPDPANGYISNLYPNTSEGIKAREIRKAVISRLKLRKPATASATIERANDRKVA